MDRSPLLCNSEPRLRNGVTEKVADRVESRKAEDQKLQNSGRRPLAHFFGGRLCGMRQPRPALHAKPAEAEGEGVTTGTGNFWNHGSSSLLHGLQQRRRLTEPGQYEPAGSAH